MATNSKPVKLKSLRHTNIATWNTHGKVNDPFQREILLGDMKKYKIKICCFQETRCEEMYTKSDDGLIITMPFEPDTAPHFKYGLGFFIAPDFINFFSGTKNVSNRIAVIQFKIPLQQRSLRLTIINVYAPTSERVKNNENEATEFYEKLQTTYSEYRGKSHYIMIAGDLNSKLGQKFSQDETFIGHHGKGTRNKNGHLLAEFLQTNQLYATNTTFETPLSHRTTWSMKIGDKTRYNQIDYIIIQQSKLRRGHQRLITNSRSYNGMDFESDHRMVVTTFNFKATYNQHTDQATETFQFDRTALSTNPDIQEKYEQQLATGLDTIQPNDMETPAKHFEALISEIKKATKLAIPENPPQLKTTINRKKFMEDKFIKDWTREKQRIRIRLQSNPSRRNRQKLIKRRNLLSRWLRERSRLLREQKVIIAAKHLEQFKGNKRCFEAVDIMKKSEYKPLRLLDKQNHEVYNTGQLLPMIKTFYNKFFNQENCNDPIDSWTGTARPLETPITAEEVQRATKKLNNGRAFGKDGTPGELYRYGGPKLCEHLAKIYNTIFEKHEGIQEIGEGVLIVLNKLNGKPPDVTNSRPITLLNMIRKIFSNVVLFRIQDIIESFVSPSQSAFRSKRGTADVIWSYRWIMATTQKYITEMNIMGIDLSKAFDCINRTKLMEILQELLKEKPSELRMIRYLMSNTNLVPRVQGRYGDKFTTTLGIPQGDGLSPALFIIYLQAAINHHRQKQNEADPQLVEATEVTHYADDTDFISQHYGYNYSTSLQLPEDLKEYNLQMNPGKTEWITVNRGTCEQLNNKKLGSRLSQKSDVKARIIAARAAFGKMNKIWLNKGNITLPTKLYIYNMFVKSILSYNLGCLGLSEKQLQHMDSMHRKHLRILAGIFYPMTISNIDLYKLCTAKPFHLQAIKYRWKLFGHILRLPESVPAHKTMLTYFQNPDRFKLQKGRQPNNLPTQLHKDLIAIGKQLKTEKDFLNPAR